MCGRYTQFASWQEVHDYFNLLGPPRNLEARYNIAPTQDAPVIGVPLMREAFKPGSGPLTDPAAVKGEQEALSALFAGAIGMFKNPSSHRSVNFSDPTEVVEMLMHASHLLRIVDARRP